MKVYHGSWVEVSKPDLKHSRPDVDFGRGCYTTSIKNQAVKWCGRFKRRGKSGIISCYEFDEAASYKLNIRNFETYSEDWLDFILACRREMDTSDYDIVMGGVANDKVFNTVELYFEHLIDKKEAINRLRYEKPNIQICFRTEEALRLLHYEGSVKV